MPYIVAPVKQFLTETITSAYCLHIAPEITGYFISHI